MESEFQKKEFARLFSEGDKRGLKYFFNEYYASLVFYSHSILKNREIAEEIVSEAFFKTWKQHHHLDSYKGIRAYLYKVVNRDSRKAAGNARTNDDIHKYFEELGEAAFDENLIAAETMRLVRNAIKALPPKMRIVIEECYFNQRSAVEVAKSLNLPTSTIRSQKLRGLAELRKRLNLKSLNSFLPLLTILAHFCIVC